MNKTLNVLIVDDNEISSAFVSEVAGNLPGVAGVMIAEDGMEGLAVLNRSPVDMVLLDIEMPELDGIETLKRIRKEKPLVDVIMMSAAHESDADKVVKALEMGAIDFIPKILDSKHSLNDFRLRLLTVTGLVRSRLNMRRGASGEAVEPSVRQAPFVIPVENRIHPPAARRIHDAAAPYFPPVREKFKIAAIAVSTGGPNALGEVIPRLPEKLGIPILIVQHMPDFLTRSLAQSLQKKSKLPVKEAVDGDMIQPDHVYLAAGGKHMTIKKELKGNSFVHRIRLNTGPPVNSVRPSADILFKSLPDAYKGSILCVIMTGMGSDGAEGVRAMKESGCYCITQTADTCIVYGMPKSVDEAMLSDERAPLHLIADRIVSLVNRG